MVASHHGRDPCLGAAQATSSVGRKHRESTSIAHRVAGGIGSGTSGAALMTGLRQGEVLGPHWRDLELAGGTPRVTRAHQAIDGKPRLKEPKSEMGRRTVPLSPCLHR